MDIRELDKRALRATESIVEKLQPVHWAQPTPCAKWAVRDIVAHMIGNNLRLASAADGTPPQPVEDTPDEELAERFRDSASRLTAAFVSEESLDRPIDLHQFGSHPGQIALGVHFVDILVHGWDISTAIGLDYEMPSDLAEIGIKIAERYPDNAAVRGPNAAFSMPVRVADDTSASHRLVALLGRRPTSESQLC